MLVEQRSPRKIAAPNLAPKMTPVQQRAQDVTVAVLRKYADEAEDHLRIRNIREKSQADTQLCPCGIRLDECLCLLRRGLVKR